MTRYGPSPAEAKEIAEAIGCRVVLEQRVHDGTYAQHLECPSHGAKVKLLGKLAEYDAQDAKQVSQLRTLSERVVPRNAPPIQRAKALLDWFQRNVRHTLESVETFTPAWRTIETGSGDCDDHARALAALFQVSGLKAGLGTLGNPPTHVAAKVKIGPQWYWAESTVVGAKLGEAPREAVKRVAGTRADLAESGGIVGPFSVANAATLTAAVAGAYWAAGGGNELAALAIAADLAARPIGKARGTWDGRSAQFNAAVDFALAPMALSRANAPPWAYPLVTVAQVAAKQSAKVENAAGLIAAGAIMFAAYKGNK